MQPLNVINAGDVYRKQSILTANPAELIVLLYDGLKKNLLLAKRHIDRRNAFAAHECLMKGQAIVEELINCLDMNIQLSEDLLALYEFMLHEMAEANLKKDSSFIPPVVDIVTELEEAWEAIAASNKGILSLVND